jgi:hypothetical protein
MSGLSTNRFSNRLANPGRTAKHHGWPPGGPFNGAQILKPETVALMRQNHIGDLNVVTLKTAHPDRSNDANLFPGMTQKRVCRLTPIPNLDRRDAVQEASPGPDFSTPTSGLIPPRALPGRS